MWLSLGSTSSRFGGIYWPLTDSLALVTTRSPAEVPSSRWSCGAHTPCYFEHNQENPESKLVTTPLNENNKMVGLSSPSKTTHMSLSWPGVPTASADHNTYDCFLVSHLYGWGLIQKYLLMVRESLMKHWALVGWEQWKIIFIWPNIKNHKFVSRGSEKVSVPHFVDPSIHPNWSCRATASRYFLSLLLRHNCYTLRGHKRTLSGKGNLSKCLN